MPIRKSSVPEFSVPIDFFRHGQRNLGNSLDYQIIGRSNHTVLRNHNTYARRQKQQDCCLQEYLHIHLPFTNEFQLDEVEPEELTGAAFIFDSYSIKQVGRMRTSAAVINWDHCLGLS